MSSPSNPTRPQACSGVHLMVCERSSIGPRGRTSKMTGPWNNKALLHPHQLPWELVAKHLPCAASVTRCSNHQGRYYCHKSHKVEEIYRIPGRGPTGPSHGCGDLPDSSLSLHTAPIQANTKSYQRSSQSSLTPLSSSSPSRPSKATSSPA